MPLVGCQEPMVVRMASNEATTTGGKLREVYNSIFVN